jgi:glycosyltransferase involved in cell wall biosynthesis
VVQPDASSFPEILGDSGGGVRTAPGDAVELAQAWKRLLDNPDGMREMGECARVAAVERFDVSVMRRGFLDLIERGNEGKGGKGLTNRHWPSF